VSVVCLSVLGVGGDTHSHTQPHYNSPAHAHACRLLTTIYYLNPAWEPAHGGRFLPWPCSDKAAADKARAAQLPSTMLTFDDLPPDAQKQIPANARYGTDIYLEIVLDARHTGICRHT